VSSSEHVFERLRRHNRRFAWWVRLADVMPFGVLQKRAERSGWVTRLEEPRAECSKWASSEVREEDSKRGGTSHRLEEP
jgi:hypothetical protein